MRSRRDSPVPSAHVQGDDESPRDGGLLTQERPIRLSDIDRVLEEHGNPNHWQPVLSPQQEAALSAIMSPGICR